MPRGKGEKEKKGRGKEGPIGVKTII